MTPDEGHKAPQTPATELDMERLAASDMDVSNNRGPLHVTQEVTAAQSEGKIILKRFLQHRAAMIALVCLILLVILAVSSIGIDIFGWHTPHWWAQSYATPNPGVSGDPTMEFSLWPFHFSLGEHPFGTDEIGHDYFAMVMRGMQQSLTIALIVGFVATVVGTIIGSLAGYFRGWTETVLMRTTDVILTIPVIVVAAVVGNRLATTGLSVAMLGVFLGLFTWTSLSRIVRGEFLSLREKEFVEAARSVGARNTRIIFRHILPNTVGVIIVAATLMISNAIILETSLSFLGFGVKSPDVSLGLLLNTNRSAMGPRPWLFWWPGLFIVAIALTINFIGDGLRDAFDPKQKRV